MSSTPADQPASFDVGAVLAAPTKDPRWVVTCGAMGLWALVPIVGALNLAGWVRAVAERRMAGGDDALTLPPARLAYVGAGWRMFLARAPLGLLFALFLAVAGGASFALIRLGDGGEVLGLLVMLGAYGAVLVGSLVASLLAPAIDFLHIVEDEPWASVAFGRQWEVIRAGGLQYLLVFVAALVAGLLAQLGALACLVGLFVSMPYSFAVQGATVAEYARILAARPTTPSRRPAVGGVGGVGGNPFGV
ncbi:MAG: hypothetical protein FJ137_10435 [Deltaproteobacteria bacterium]|nr:hypothetical protein [Deltaproteobacteria bacterium]